MSRGENQIRQKFWGKSRGENFDTNLKSNFGKRCIGRRNANCWENINILGAIWKAVLIKSIKIRIEPLKVVPVGSLVDGCVVVADDRRFGGKN